MKRWPVVMILLLGTILLTVGSVGAQDSETYVAVEFQIDQIKAENLQEDGIFDDAEDEMTFTYELVEVGPDGVVQHWVSDAMRRDFDDEEVAPASEFDTLRLVAEPSNQVYILIKAVEQDREGESAVRECGLDGIADLIECQVSGDCPVNNDVLEACLQMLTGSDNDLFEETIFVPVNLAEFGTIQQDGEIEDRGDNNAEYDIDWTVTVMSTTETPNRDRAGLRYIFSGELTDENTVDNFDIRIETGFSASVRVSRVRGNLNTVVAILDLNDDVQAINDDAQNFDTTNSIIDSYTPIFGGEYKVAVSRPDSTEGIYVLDVLLED